MATAFIAALGALRAHQGWLDVIGNNLANANTTGFKSSRALFSELLSVTVRPATGPTSNLGGTNPLQKGIGTQLGGAEGEAAGGGRGGKGHRTEEGTTVQHWASKVRIASAYGANRLNTSEGSGALHGAR